MIRKGKGEGEELLKRRGGRSSRSSETHNQMEHNPHFLLASWHDAFGSVPMRDGAFLSSNRALLVKVVW
ncbi:uncharacterized protein [Physcomitrium patens]|uniref:uncharacterized protein isoform X2 n=1 Tax=Physcomitrium patens TaxID=3218 RepID=UPI003CCDF50E